MGYVSLDHVQQVKIPKPVIVKTTIDMKSVKGISNIFVQSQKTD